MPELMTVVAQCQRCLDILRQWMKTREMIKPGIIVQPIKTNCRGRTIIAPARSVLGKFCRSHLTVKTIIEVKVDGSCLVTCHDATLS